MGMIKRIRTAKKEEVKQEWLRINRKYQAGEVLSESEQATLIEMYALASDLVIDPEKLKQEMARIAHTRQLRLANQI